MIEWKDPMAHSAHVPVDRAQRFALIIPLHYRRKGLSHWQDSRTINISRTGVLFQADEKLTENSILDIQIKFPKRATLACQGAVVRTEGTACAVRIHRFSLNKE